MTMPVSGVKKETMVLIHVDLMRQSASVVRMISPRLFWIPKFMAHFLDDREDFKSFC